MHYLMKESNQYEKNQYQHQVEKKSTAGRKNQYQQQVEQITNGKAVTQVIIKSEMNFGN